MSERVNAGMGVVLGKELSVHLEANIVEKPSTGRWLEHEYGDPKVKQVTLSGCGESVRRFGPLRGPEGWVWRELLTPEEARFKITELMALMPKDDWCGECTMGTSCRCRQHAQKILQALGYEVQDV